MCFHRSERPEASVRSAIHFGVFFLIRSLAPLPLPSVLSVLIGVIGGSLSRPPQSAVCLFRFNFSNSFSTAS